jgi:hypothetical protein
MHLTRRGLLRMLLATPAAAFVDYERLLWVPTPQIVVPAMPLIFDDVAHAELLPGITDQFFRSGPLMEYLRGRFVTPSPPLRFDESYAQQLVRLA